MSEEPAKTTIKLLRTEERYALSVRWMGWKRCLWLAFQVDLECPAVCVIFFGLMVSFGPVWTAQIQVVPTEGREGGLPRNDLPYGGF